MPLSLKQIHDEITKKIEISYPRIIINNGIPTKVLSDEQEMLIRSKMFKQIWKREYKTNWSTK